MYSNLQNNWDLLSATSSPKSQFDRGNITRCKADKHGSAICLYLCYKISFEFCEIHANTGPGCILINGGSISSIRCLSVRSNLCTGTDSYRGLFYTDTPITIRDSIISGNNVTYVANGGSTITFANCHLDSFILDTTGHGASTLGVTILSCRTNASDISW
jgi:hypothetical protein